MANIQFSMGFDRLNREPLDASQVFEDLAAFELYLASGPAYAGQIVAVKNSTNYPDTFIVNEDYTYSPVGDAGGDSSAAVNAHNVSGASHVDIRSEITNLEARVEGVESLGSWAGTFDAFALVPDNISGFAHVTRNDYVYVRADENHSGLYARYFAETIDSGTGDITWGFDRTWGDVSLGTAADVKAGDTLTVTQAAGGWTIGSQIAETDSVWDFIKRLLNPRVAAQYTQPNLTLAGTTPLTREIGENITPTLTPNWSQNDGGAIEEYRLEKNGTNIYTGAAAVAHADTTFQLAAATIYQAEADYEQGPIKNDSEGNPDPAGQIAAGTRQSSLVTYTPARRGFYGALSDGTIPDTSAFIRGLASNTLTMTNGTTMAVDLVAGNRGCCFAYPATLRAASSIIQAGLGMDVKNGFTELIVSVEGANGYTGIDYRVYYLLPEFPFGASERFTLTI